MFFENKVFYVCKRKYVNNIVGIINCYDVCFIVFKSVIDCVYVMRGVMVIVGVFFCKIVLFVKMGYIFFIVMFKVNIFCYFNFIYENYFCINRGKYIIFVLLKNSINVIFYYKMCYIIDNFKDEENNKECYVFFIINFWLFRLFCKRMF